MKNSSQLRQILVRTRNTHVNSQKTLAVFDIDSTLYDVSPRVEKILFDFSQSIEFQRKFPEQTQLLQQIKTLSTDWGITQALQRIGLDGHHPEFQEAIFRWWKTHFFSNDYLKYDAPYAGAVDYVRALYEAGAHIVYLTGRDVHRMGAASPTVLIESGFPLGLPNTELVLKPHLSMDDARFKTDWFHEKLKSESFDFCVFFENEPVNVNLLKKEKPEVDIIFFNSTHSGKETAPLDIPHIMDYLCHLHED